MYAARKKQNNIFIQILHYHDLPSFQKCVCEKKQKNNNLKIKDTAMISQMEQQYKSLFSMQFTYLNRKILFSYVR